MIESEQSTDFSSPKRYMEEDTDKQILQWAGKLELESIDLRDKSSQLISTLERNSKELHSSYEKLSAVTNGISDFKVTELANKIQYLGDAHDKLSNRIDTFDTRFEDWGARMTTELQIRDACWKKSLETTQDAVQSLTHQMESLCEVVQLVSRDLQLVAGRQVSLERRITDLSTNLTQEAHVTNTCSSRVTPSQPTKSRGATQRHVREPTAASARWIIPWDEISDSETLLSSEL